MQNTIFARTVRTAHNFHPATTLPDMPESGEHRRLATRRRDSYADFGV
jgi:hypothetical protein